jgi:hypothetical protein
LLYGLFTEVDKVHAAVTLPLATATDDRRCYQLDDGAADLRM